MDIAKDIMYKNVYLPFRANLKCEAYKLSSQALP